MSKTGDETGPHLMRLALALRGPLERAMELSPAVMGFIDSTFSNPTAEFLNGILRDESHPDADGLRELLLSPDEPLLIEVEALLAGHAWQPAEEEALIEFLYRPPACASLRFPDGRGALSVEVTPELARRWVSPFNLTRRLPAELDAAIGPAARTRRLVRNSRVTWSVPAIAFARALLQTQNPADDPSLAVLDFALDVVADAPAGADIFQALSARRRLLLRALQQIRRQQENLARLPIEVLASQGVRPIVLDEPDTRSKIAALDRVCLAVFGRTAATETPVVETAAVDLS
jgi:hypothetical protein